MKINKKFAAMVLGVATTIVTSGCAGPHQDEDVHSYIRHRDSRIDIPVTYGAARECQGQVLEAGSTSLEHDFRRCTAKASGASCLDILDQREQNAIAMGLRDPKATDCLGDRQLWGQKMALENWSTM